MVECEQHAIGTSPVPRRGMPRRLAHRWIVTGYVRPLMGMRPPGCGGYTVRVLSPKATDNGRGWQVTPSAPYQYIAMNSSSRANGSGSAGASAVSPGRSVST
jgi:hypothetical protein